MTVLLLPYEISSRYLVMKSIKRSVAFGFILMYN